MHFSCGRNKIVTSFNSEKVSRSHTLGLTAAKQQIRPSRPGCPRPGRKGFEVGSPGCVHLEDFFKSCQKKKKKKFL